MEHGLFDVKEQSLTALASLNSLNSIEFIIKAVDDPIKSVSLAAIDAIEKMGLYFEYQDIICERREFWKQMELRKFEMREKRKLEKKKIAVQKWERSSSKTFENVKKMLKSPMYFGKW